MKVTNGKSGTNIKFDNPMDMIKALGSEQVIPDLGMMLKNNPEYFEECKKKTFSFAYTDENRVRLSKEKEGLELIINFPENSFFGNSNYLATFRLPKAINISKVKNLLKKKN